MSKTFIILVTVLWVSNAFSSHKKSVKRSAYDSDIEWTREDDESEQSDSSEISTIEEDDGSSTDSQDEEISRSKRKLKKRFNYGDIFKCRKCDYATNNRGNFFRHCSNQHDMYTYRCTRNDCKDVFKTKAEHNKHIMYGHTRKVSRDEIQKKYTLTALKDLCTLCAQGVFIAHDCKKSLRNKDATFYKCPFCHVAYETYNGNSYRRHLQKWHKIIGNFDLDTQITQKTKRSSKEKVPAFTKQEKILSEPKKSEPKLDIILVNVQSIQNSTALAINDKVEPLLGSASPIKGKDHLFLESTHGRDLI